MQMCPFATMFMTNQNIVVVLTVQVNQMTTMKKFVLALNVAVVYIGTEIFGNVQTVTIQKKINSIKA